MGSSEDRVPWSVRHMERNSSSASWKDISTLFRSGSLCGLTDRHLLDLFVAGDREGDGAEAEAAFEVLVTRHGPMVQRLCRSLLNNHHDAEDAFQATFLVLARRAGSIRDRTAVASWLYGVAARVAARAPVEGRRRRMLERVVTEQSSRKTRLHPSDPPEPMPELHEEVARLPERYRAPIVLCYLESKSHEEAARILGCRLRTLQTRLQRGKSKLRVRLLRRGLAPATTLLAAGLTGSEHPAETAADGLLASGLSSSTAHAAVQFAAAGASGLSSAALRLAQGVSKTLFLTRMRRAVTLAACVTLARHFVPRTARRGSGNRQAPRHGHHPRR